MESTNRVYGVPSANLPGASPTTLATVRIVAPSGEIIAINAADYVAGRDVLAPGESAPIMPAPTSAEPSILHTVRIVSSETADGTMRINVSDYDPARDVLAPGETL